MQHQQRATADDDGGTLAIEATNVGLTYSNGTEAVTDVTLRIPTGEFFGFLGPNGAGKTTMIKTLVTLLRPTKGRITVDGYDVQSEPTTIRESIGYMAQETSIDPSLTVRENLHFACRAYGVPKPERTDRIDDLLALVDLTDKEHSRAGTLSGGQKKRLDAATALAHNPPIVFLDEPTSGLDPAARNRLWGYFREINRQGTTVFLTTQYMEEADALCSNLAVIRDGEIVATGSPSELKSQVGGDILEISFDSSAETVLERASAVIEESEVMTPNEAETIQMTGEEISVTSSRARRIGSDVLVQLTEAGFDITGFNVRSPTLDDVFLALTGETTPNATQRGQTMVEQQEERQ